MRVGRSTLADHAAVAGSAAQPPSLTMADINGIAKEFTNFYYASFAKDRSLLSPLYVRSCAGCL